MKKVLENDFVCWNIKILKEYAQSSRDAAIGTIESH